MENLQVVLEEVSDLSDDTGKLMQQQQHQQKITANLQQDVQQLAADQQQQDVFRHFFAADAKQCDHNNCSISPHHHCAYQYKFTRT